MKAPKIQFPGGYVQILNPKYPICKAWSDILFLSPKALLPEHKHEHSSSLLVCLEGEGTIWLNGIAKPVSAGDIVFIESGTWHKVKASEDSSLKCLSINEGIIKKQSEEKDPVDFRLKEPEVVSAEEWQDFFVECSKAATNFADLLQKEGIKQFSL